MELFNFGPHQRGLETKDLCSFRETEPLVFQLPGRSTRGGWPGHEHYPDAVVQSVLMSSHDVAEPAADAIPHHRATDSFRGDEPGPEAALLLRQHTEDQQCASMRVPVGFDLKELSRAGKPPRFREGERRRCSRVVHHLLVAWEPPDRLRKSAARPSLYSKSLPAANHGKTLRMGLNR
ncbi:hypothetical protein BH20VER2_BH20VER2_04640 [soil metagenome]